MKTRRSRTLVTAALLSFGVTFSILSLEFSSSARRLPLFAGALIIVTAALQLITDLRRPAQHSEADSKPSISERSAVAWLAALVGGVYMAGLTIAPPVFASAYWRFKDRSSWPAAIGVGLCVLAFVQGVLVWLLQLDLFDGIIGQWLFR